MLKWLCSNRAPPPPLGIVYVFSQKDAESLSGDLQKRKVLAGCYHANMEAEEKTRIHRKWTNNQIQVCLTTSVFITISYYDLTREKWRRWMFPFR